FFGLSNLSKSCSEETDIIGRWISTDDENSEKEFKSNGKCYDYYKGVLTDTYNYSIIKTSPVCGKNVPTGDLFSYLELVNINDSSDIYCYEITSLDKTDFQIRFLGRTGFLSYKRK
ncbi:MAG: hypothetical protein ACWIPI_10225, partial [Polaribacter sp.]